MIILKLVLIFCLFTGSFFANAYVEKSDENILNSLNEPQMTLIYDLFQSGFIAFTNRPDSEPDFEKNEKCQKRCGQITDVTKKLKCFLECMKE